MKPINEKSIGKFDTTEMLDSNATSSCLISSAKHSMHRHWLVFDCLEIRQPLQRPLPEDSLFDDLPVIQLAPGLATKATISATS